MVPLTVPVAAVLDGIERVPGNPWVIVGKTPGGRMSSVKHYWHRIRAQAEHIRSSHTVNPLHITSRSESSHAERRRE